MHFAKTLKGSLLALLLLGPVTWALAQDPWSSYTHPQQKFTLQYPGDWEATEDMEYQTFKIPFLALRPVRDENDVFRENLNVVTEKVSSSLKSKAYLELNLKQMGKVLKGFKSLEKGEFSGGTTGGHYMVYRHKDAVAGDLQVMVFCFTAGTRGYALTCTSTPKDFGSYRETFLRIGRSFKP